MVRFDKNLSAEKNYNNAAGCHCECCSTSTHYTILHFYMNLSVENYTSVDDCRKFCSTSTQCCVLTETCLGRKLHYCQIFCSTSSQWCVLTGNSLGEITIMLMITINVVLQVHNGVFWQGLVRRALQFYLTIASSPHQKEVILYTILGLCIQ